MSKFTVRVELHAASESDYQKLHEAMEKGGFSRLIKGSDGKAYHLPTAEYDHQSTASAEQVREKAYAIASAVKPNPAVLVTEGSRVWKGLAEAD